MIVDSKFCFKKLDKYEECQPFWSEWSEAGPCVKTEFNSTGGRTRTIKCLYGDDSETFDAQLCSNQSSFMREECTENLANVTIDSKSHEITPVTKQSDLTSSFRTVTVLTKSYFLTQDAHESSSSFYSFTSDKNASKTFNVVGIEESAYVADLYFYFGVVVATVFFFILLSVCLKTKICSKFKTKIQFCK